MFQLAFLLDEEDVPTKATISEQYEEQTVETGNNPVKDMNLSLDIETKTTEQHQKIEDVQNVIMKKATVAATEISSAYSEIGKPAAEQISQKYGEAKRYVGSLLQNIQHNIPNAIQTESKEMKQEKNVVTTQTENVKCPKCGKSLSTEVKFCNYCGTKIVPMKYCSECGSQIEKTAKFCSFCGAKTM
jgi:hypothetical protein